MKPPKAYIITKTKADRTQLFDFADDYKEALKIYTDALEEDCKVEVFHIGDLTSVFALAYISII